MAALSVDRLQCRDPAMAGCIRRQSEMVAYVTEAADHSPRSRQVMTARQWQLAHGQAAIEWVRTSGIAQRMLGDICAAVEATIEWLVQGNPQRARWVLRQ